MALRFPVVVLVIHTYQNLPQRNTLVGRRGKKPMHGQRIRANIPSLLEGVIAVMGVEGKN